MPQVNEYSWLVLSLKFMLLFAMFMVFINFYCPSIFNNSRTSLPLFKMMISL